MRVALGATPQSIVALVRQAAIIGTAGLVMGTALAVLVAEALSGVLFGIDPLAVMPIVLTAATLIVVVLLAGVRPGSTRVEGRAARRTQKLIGCAFSVTSHSGFGTCAAHLAHATGTDQQR